MKVENMKSYRGNVVPNQFVITIGDAVYFQSYESTIAKVQGGRLTLGLHWDYSPTTRRFLNKFLEENLHKYAGLKKQQVQKLIDEKEIGYIAEKNFN